MKLWDKFLVVRRDGTVPEWPYLVIGARDPAAPAALRAYAEEAERLGFDPELTSDIRGQAGDFERYRAEHGDGDPDAGPHRPEDLAVTSRIRAGSRRVYAGGQPPAPGPAPASEEAPVYARVPQSHGSTLWMITWDEGWRSGILCSSMYEADADFLLTVLGRKPRPAR